MEQLHLHQLFQEMSSKLVCPECKKKIPPTALELQESQANTCTFEAACDNCGHIVGISAIIETEITQEGKMLNASSRIHKGNVSHIPITHEEIDSIKKDLTQMKSFNDIFNS